MSAEWTFIVEIPIFKCNLSEVHILTRHGEVGWIQWKNAARNMTSLILTCSDQFHDIIILFFDVIMKFSYVFSTAAQGLK